MWFLLQGSIIFAVVASNIHWKWTPNGYLASMIGVGLAYGITALLSAGTGHELKRTSEFAGVTEGHSTDHGPITCK